MWSGNGVRSCPSTEPSIASDPDDACAVVRVTHPFHPLFGRQFRLVHRRSCWSLDRVFYEDEDGSVRGIPTAWTSVAEEDSFVRISAGRSFFRIEDLLALAALLRDLEQECGDGGTATPVKETSPYV